MIRTYTTCTVWEWASRGRLLQPGTWTPTGTPLANAPQWHHGAFGPHHLHVWIPKDADRREEAARLFLAWRSAIRRGLKVILDDLTAQIPF